MTRKYELTKTEWDFVNTYVQSRGLPTDRTVTYDDIPMPDLYSEVRSREEILDDPHAFDTEIYPGIKLGTPLILANMACLAGAEAIVAFEREGGLGIPPQMLSLKERLEILEWVGRAESACIDKPFTIAPDKTLGEAKEFMDKIGIHGLIVVDENKKPIGVFSKRDWQYELDTSVRVGDLMRRRVITAAKDISLTEAAKKLRKHRIEKLPLVDKKGKLVGMMTAHGVFYKHHHPRATRDERGRFLKIGSVGVGRFFDADRMKQVDAQVRKGISLLLIDTARAFSINAKEAITAVRERYPKLPLMVGNTCNPAGAKALFEWGADIVKVGIGPGDACRTRKTGIGIPQLTAVARCAAIAEMLRKEGRHVTIIADGGIKNPGDTYKGMYAGASGVMIGRLFAGTHESAADTDVDEDARPVKEYIGSASYKAQKERIANRTLDKKRRPEGVAKLVPVIGSMEDVIHEHLGGLASAMSMQGVRNMEEIKLYGKFDLPQSSAGLMEGIKRK